jgi:hypothetical protein
MGRLTHGELQLLQLPTQPSDGAKHLRDHPANANRYRDSADRQPGRSRLTQTAQRHRDAECTGVSGHHAPHPVGSGGLRH